MESGLSFEEVSNSFNSESEKLKEAINFSLEKSDKFSIPEIINNYFQIMNVNSHIQLLKKHSENIDNNDQPIFQQVKEIEDIISNKFNNVLHPKMLSQLKSSIDELTKSLQTNTPQDNSKESLEKNAKLYDSLREMMSTKEFVEQYEKGLTHD